ncbi:hypothetical protein MKJ04_00340 [Pontibacter sp. E15-1]|uniref:hypothetical protein n=1 Tax=Pontibacter sp. E15-1 TaxID=2919918 RepID=UPI001F4F7385|nr:hypothetical protein [Pontibacter sp. E15-1]MCJ8163270.1 hypothetical protein [Pontibacter sp. E15-1]
MLLCTLADILITLLIYAFVGLLLQEPRWLSKMSWRKVLLALSVSMVTAVTMEKIPLLLGWWGYSARMPLLPWVQVGLTPFLQISLLPLLTLLLGSFFSTFGKRG